MRDLKFRAWYESNVINTSIGPTFIKKWKMGNVHIFHFNKNKVLLNDATGVESFDVGEKCIVMQYTGLKDKNGREIYEGDIVVHHFMVYQGHENVGEDKETIIIKDIAKLPFDGSSIGCEVIGNIHEHPHLLKEE